jgi:hypothetical protein
VSTTSRGAAAPILQRTYTHLRAVGIAGKYQRKRKEE